MFDEIVSFFEFLGGLINGIIENCCLSIFLISTVGIVILIYLKKRKKAGKNEN